MLQRCAGLTTVELAAIAELERRTVAADGGRLKLEWGVLRSRSGEQVDDLLWWDGDRVTGFMGLYTFGGVDVELAGMVDPSARRRGIATEMLDAALPLLRQRGHGPALLVCPRATDSGRHFAAGRLAVFDHSEYALLLRGEPTDGPEDPEIVLRAATPDDAEDVTRLLESGFGNVPADVRSMLAGDRTAHLVVLRAGTVIGYIRPTLDEDTGGVFGFVVDAELRGRGIGRDVLRRVCRGLRSQGALRVGLEVAVENERALGLYTSLGFRGVTTEDYFRLPPVHADESCAAAVGRLVP